MRLGAASASFHVTAAAGIVLGSVVGCASPKPGTSAGFREAFPWIEVTRTPRTEFVSRLGEPHADFESGRLAAWRVECGLTGVVAQFEPLRENPYRRQDRWGDTTLWSLVVRFDEAGRAARVEVVPLR